MGCQEIGGAAKDAHLLLQTANVVSERGGTQLQRPYLCVLLLAQLPVGLPVRFFYSPYGHLVFLPLRDLD